MLVKNFVQFSAGTLAYWLIGYGFAFGDAEGFIGDEYFGGKDWINDQQFRCFSYTGLVGIFVVYIVNGAVSERLSYVSSICFTLFLMVFAWPVVVSWVWGHGWLRTEMDEEITDLGGSIVVYTFAGAFGLVATLITGARAGKNSSVSGLVPFDMVNHEFYIIGSLLTVLGCFGIGFGQQSTEMFGYALANLWICGGVTCLITNQVVALWNPSLEMNLITVYQGFIAGMVLISSAGFNTTPWQAGLHGILSSFAFISGLLLVKWTKLDDPVNIISTFLLPGICGGILPGFVDDVRGVYWTGWESGQLLGVQTVGTVVVFAWACFWSFVTFGLLWIGHILLIDDSLQTSGLAKAKLTQAGYQYVVPVPED